MSFSTKSSLKSSTLIPKSSVSSMFLVLFLDFNFTDMLGSCFIPHTWGSSVETSKANQWPAGICLRLILCPHLLHGFV